MSDSGDALKLGLVARGLVVMMTLALGLYAWDAFDLANALTPKWFETHIMGQGLAGEALFLGLAAIATAAGLPRQVVSGLAGYAFGLAWGAALGLAGTVLGCMGAFYYARVLARGPLRRKFSARVRRLDDFLREHTFTMTLLVRLLPVGNNAVTNLTAGVSSVRAAPFFAGSALGYVPQTLIFALLGSGVAVDKGLQIVLSAVLFVASGVLGVYLYRRFRHGKSLETSLDSDANGDDDEGGASATA